MRRRNRKQDPMAISEVELTQMTRDLDKKQRDLTTAQEQFKADTDALNQELLETFRDKVLPVIDEYTAFLE